MQAEIVRGCALLLLSLLLIGLSGLASAETKIDLKDTSIYGDQEKPVVELDVPWKETDMTKIEPQPLPDLFDKRLKFMLKKVLDVELSSADSSLDLRQSKTGE